MPASVPLQDALLAHVFGGASFTKPSAWWIQLHYGDPGNYCTSNAWTAAGRKQCTSWSAVASSSVSNAVQVKWTNVPDPGANPRIKWVSIWTNSTNGTPLMSVQLGTEMVVGPGDELTIAAGMLTINNQLPTDLGDVTGTVSVSLVGSRIVKMRLTGNVDLSSGFTAPATMEWRMLVITQDATGGRTVTWPTLYGTEPMVDPIANATTVVWLVWDGSKWHVMD